MTEKEEKIIKISRLIVIAIRLIFGISVLLVMLAIFWPLFFENSEPFTLIMLDDSEKFRELSSIAYFAVTGLTVASIICMIVEIFLFYKIFDEISKDARPFKIIHVTRIKIISLLMLVNFLLSIVVDFILNLSFNINLTFLLSILIVIAVAFILESGCELQEQADTTL